MGFAVSGLTGVVGGQKGVTQWQVSDTIQNTPYVASNTKAGTVRLPGIKDWSGSWQSQSVVPLAMPGQRMEFQGDAGPNEDNLAQHWLYGGDVIIASLQVQWDWTRNAPITYSYSFMADGPMSQVSGTPLTDVSEEVGKSSFNNFIYIGDSMDSGGSGGTGDKMCARTATLNITSKLTQNADSCSEGYFQRVAGPLDWTLTMNFAGNDLASYWKNGDYTGDIVALSAFVDEPNMSHWFLKWGRIASLSNLSVNISSGEIISASGNVEMSAYDDADVLGEVTIPTANGTTAWWPNNTNLALYSPAS